MQEGTVKTNNDDNVDKYDGRSSKNYCNFL